jgi:hypothetical protein
MESRSGRCSVAEATIINGCEGRREQAMRKALTITLVATLALFAGSAAYANWCARDVVPASTLLVPYAVQDMTAEKTPSGDGYTTILTVTNVSRDAQIIHITVWAADSTACLDFNEVLTGYDMWQIFFRDMLAGNFGLFDTTTADGVGPNGGNRAPFEWGPDGRSAYTGYKNEPTILQTPEKTTKFALDPNCYMPYGNGVPVSTNIDCLRAPLFQRLHNGCANLKVRADFDNDWLKNIPTDKKTTNPIWFYVTVDVVTKCNFDFPSSDNYFDTAYGVYKNVNVLIGDIVYLAKAANFSEAISAVHIETDPEALAANYNLFYEEKAKFASPGTNIGLLHLEPLATAFAFNYYDIPSLSISSNVLLWKNRSDFISPSQQVDDCGYYFYYTWDMDEHTGSRSGSCRISPCNQNDIDPNEFPFETQSVPLKLANFDLVGQAGWMLIVFPPSYNGGDPTPNVVNYADRMGWVGVKINYGAYSAALEAATMANAHCFPTQRMPILGVNYNYTPAP